MNKTNTPAALTQEPVGEATLQMALIAMGLIAQFAEDELPPDAQEIVKGYTESGVVGRLVPGGREPIDLVFGILRTGLNTPATPQPAAGVANGGEAAVIAAAQAVIDDFGSSNNGPLQELYQALLAHDAAQLQPRTASVAQTDQPGYDIEAAVKRCGSHRSIPEDVKTKIRAELQAAIAQPKQRTPAEPSDADLAILWGFCNIPTDENDHTTGPAPFARQVLARWGAAQPRTLDAPVSDAEVGAALAAYHGTRVGGWGPRVFADMRRAIEAFAAGRAPVAQTEPVAPIPALPYTPPTTAHQYVFTELAAAHAQNSESISRNWRPLTPPVAQVILIAHVTVSDDDLDMGFSEDFIAGKVRLPNGTHDLYTHPKDADSRDADLLDFVLDRGAFITEFTRDGAGTRYKLTVQDGDENYHDLSGEEKSFATKREAVIAAIKAKDATP